MRRLKQLIGKSKLRVSSSKALVAFSTCFTLNTLIPLPSQGAIEFTGDIDTLVDTVIEGSANSMGKVAGTGKTKWAWC